MFLFTILPSLLNSSIFGALNKNDALLISSVGKRTNGQISGFILPYKSTKDTNQFNF